MSCSRMTTQAFLLLALFPFVMSDSDQMLHSGMSDLGLHFAKAYLSQYLRLL